MANVENNNRIAGFVKKHVFAKRWVSIMLVIALLVTTVTMYALNKSATAVSEDSAESVGMVLDTASEDGSDDGSTEEVVAEEPAEETQEENNESTPSESEVAESTTEEPAAEASEETENTETESTVVENTESTESNESEESESESTTVAETENTEETDNTEEEAPASQAEGTEETENTENTESTENTENTENPDEELVTEETEDGTAVTEETEEVKEENELTQDVVLTVSYKDENGENIADDKAINLENSIDFAEAAPKQEGYIFKDARLDDAVITKITVEYDVNMFKYYVVTREDGSTEEVKEDKTVVLTYTKEEIAKSEIKLTAKFADKNGESIKEDAELNLTSELDVTKKENVDAIDNYFYMGATYNGEKIAKIAPVTEKTEEAATEEAENAESNTVSSYVITTKDGAEVSVTEDAEIVFTYYAAITETEFKVTNDKVTVTATLSAAGAFPEGIELNVTEVNAQTQGYNYDAYMQALNDNADKIAESNADDEATESTEENVTFDENNTILYDVAFMLEGIEYQPLKGSVAISIKFNDNQLSEGLKVTEEEQLMVVHLPVSDSIKNEVDSTSEATDITAEDITVEIINDSAVNLDEEDEVLFDLSSFSVVGAIKINDKKHTWDGNTTYSATQIVEMLGDATYFGAVTQHYYLRDDTECNVAVGKLEEMKFTNRLGNSVEVYKVLSDYRITVTKRVTGSPKRGKFYFRLYKDKNASKPITGSDFSIETNDNGIGTYTTDITSFMSNGDTASIYVFELSGENGSPLKDGDQFNSEKGNYTVSYDYDPIMGGNEILGNFSSSYIENANGYTISDMIRQISGSKLFVKKSENQYWEAVFPDRLSPEPTNGTFPISISSMLSSASAVSSQLAMATNYDNSGDKYTVQVLNIKPVYDTLSKDISKLLYNIDNESWAAVNKGYGLTIGKDTLLLINLDLSGVPNYNIDQYRINHSDTNESYTTGDWYKIANQIVVNPVQKDSNGNYVPYTGKILANTTSGVLIAPKAEVTTAGSYCGTVIADKIYQQSEIHQITVRRFLTVQGEANVYNTNGDQLVNIEVIKKWNCSDGIEAFDPSKVVISLFKKVGNDYQQITEPAPEWVNNNDNTWTCKWVGLPKAENGKDIEYYVSETTIPSGYTSSADYSKQQYEKVMFTDNGNGAVEVGKATITNTAEVEFVVHKQLNGADPANGKFKFWMRALGQNADKSFNESKNYGREKDGAEAFNDEKGNVSFKVNLATWGITEPGDYFFLIWEPKNGNENSSSVLDNSIIVVIVNYGADGSITKTYFKYNDGSLINRDSPDWKGFYNTVIKTASLGAPITSDNAVFRNEDIKVKKNWVNGECDHIYVYIEGTYTNSQGVKCYITGADYKSYSQVKELNAGNNWEAHITGLLSTYQGYPVEYSAYEINSWYENGTKEYEQSQIEEMLKNGNRDILITDSSSKIVTNKGTFTGTGNSNYANGVGTTFTFTNTFKSKLTIKKVWTKNGVAETNPDYNTQVLVDLYRKGTKEAIVKGIQLNKPTWEATIELDYEENAEYYIKETAGNGLVTTYSNDSGTTDTDPEEVTVKDNGTLGVLTVTNELGGNTLPSTGGSGTMPFAVGGLGIATLGLLGFEISRKRKRED